MSKAKYYPNLEHEVKGLVDDIRRNLTAIELADNLEGEALQVVIDNLCGSRNCIEAAVLHVRD